MAVASEPRLVILRERLAAERSDGATFTAAWDRACAEALAGLSPFHRTSWAGVLDSTRWAWRSAYYGSRSSRLVWAVDELEAYTLDGELKPLAYDPAA